MNEPLVAKAVAMLAARDPRSAVRSILDMIVARTGAKAAVVMQRRGEELSLAGGIDTTEDLVETALKAWESKHGHGKAVQVGVYTVVVLEALGNVTGMLCLEGARDGLKDMETMGTLLAAALDPPAPPARDLLQLLEDNEYNIAAVARALSVTRQTVYIRMARAGIPRKKIARGIA